MEPYTWTEPTTAIRDWLRTIDAVVAQVAQRTYAGGFPAKGLVTPAIAVTRIGGNVDVTDLGLYQFDCIDTTAPGAARVAGALVSALTAEGPQVIDPHTGVAFAGVGAITAINLTDPDAVTYRTVVTAELVTKTHPVPAP